MPSKKKKHPTWITCQHCGTRRLCYGKSYCSIACSKEAQAAYRLATNGHHLPPVASILSALPSTQAPLTEVHPWLYIESRDLFITNDWHLPIHSTYWATRLIELGVQAEGKADLAINGDFFDFDIAKITRHDGYKREHSIQHSIVAGSNMLRILLSVFSNVYMDCGNHDDRFTKAFAPLHFSDLMDMICRKIGDASSRLRWTMRNYCFLNDDWVIVHPVNYSVARLKVASEYADHFKRHCITGHEHHPCGYTMNKTNDYIAANCGAMIDKKACAYNTMKVNPKYPEWANGIARIKDGDLVLYDERTNWGKVLYGK